MEIKFFEIEFGSGYSMCVKAARKPTIKDMNKFLGMDMVMLEETRIARIIEIDAEEAKWGYDVTVNDKYPVWGAQ